MARFESEAACAVVNESVGISRSSAVFLKILVKCARYPFREDWSRCKSSILLVTAPNVGDYIGTE